MQCILSIFFAIGHGLLKHKLYNFMPVHDKGFLDYSSSYTVENVYKSTQKIRVGRIGYALWNSTRISGQSLPFVQDLANVNKPSQCVFMPLAI